MYHKKGVLGKYPIHENNTYMFSLEALLGKQTVTGTCVFCSICIKLVNIKNKIIFENR